MLKYLILIFSVLLFQGCVGYRESANKWMLDLQGGKNDQAIKKIEESASAKNAVLDSMNKGMALRYSEKHKSSNEEFAKALKKSDEYAAISITENITALTLDESSTSYIGNHFEILSLPIYRAFNYIDINECMNARVEARRINELIKEGNDPLKVLPWSVMFSGLIYEMLGEYVMARVAYRQADNFYTGNFSGQAAAKKESKRKVVAVPSVLTKSQEEVKNLVEMPNRNCADFGKKPSLGDKAEIIVVYHHSLVSALKDNRINFNAGPAGLVTIALPTYPATPNLPSPKWSLISGDKINNDMKMVANYEQLARDELEAKLPGMAARIATRLIARKAVTQAAKKASSNNDNLAMFANLLELGSVVMQQAVEVADTRAFPLTPSAVYLGRSQVPPGKHTLSLQAGSVHCIVHVEATAGKMTFVNLRSPFHRCESSVTH